jgi:ATP synthase protein I
MDKPLRTNPSGMSGVAGSKPAVAAHTKWPESIWPPEDPEPPVRPLTRDEAQALIARHPSLSAWQVIAVQALVGVLVALVWWALSRSQAALVSSLYGAAVAVLPNVLMARGVFGRHAGRSVGGLLVWELIKMVCAGAMLALAHVLIQPLSWVAMLVTMVLCMKVIGVALLMQGRMKKS